MELGVTGAHLFQVAGRIDNIMHGYSVSQKLMHHTAFRHYKNVDLLL